MVPTAPVKHSVDDCCPSGFSPLKENAELSAHVSVGTVYHLHAEREDRCQLEPGLRQYGRELDPKGDVCFRRGGGTGD